MPRITIISGHDDNYNQEFYRTFGQSGTNDYIYRSLNRSTYFITRVGWFLIFILSNIYQQLFHQTNEYQVYSLKDDLPLLLRGPLISFNQKCIKNSYCLIKSKSEFKFLNEINSNLDITTIYLFSGNKNNIPETFVLDEYSGSNFPRKLFYENNRCRYLIVPNKSSFDEISC